MTGANVLYSHPPPPLYNIHGGTPITSIPEEAEAPPSYEEAINPNGTFVCLACNQDLHLILAPPPSYDSLFGRVREAQKSSTGLIDFLRNVVIIILGTCKYQLTLPEVQLIEFLFTVGCSIILGITIVIPICMIVMGSIYLHECPQGEYIPVYLLVGGKEINYHFYSYCTYSCICF